MLNQENGSITEYRYLPHKKKMPKGWRLANDLADTHHGKHAVLIVKEYEKETKTRKTSSTESTQR